MKKFACILGLLLLTVSMARAQEYFSVLSNNTSKDGKWLYVEIMYEKPVCRDAQARFFLTHDGRPDSLPMQVMAINNPGTYTLSPDSLTLSRPQAAGYRLTFNLEKTDATATAALNPRVCIKSYTMAVKCVGCAAGGSDAIFALPDSKKAGCPYQGDDVIACYQRNTKVGATDKTDNWEAWILDERDCTPYRIVRMSDNNGGFKWWFAENLKLTANLNPNGAASSGGGKGTYWCPSGASFAAADNVTANTGATLDNKTQAAGGACDVYGALYTWESAQAVNGFGGDDATFTGICPRGWTLPQTSDFTNMFAAIREDARGTAPAAPLTLDSLLAQRLKSTISCRPHAASVDTACATASRAAWSWRRNDYAGRIRQPYALGEDRYGFEAVPAGFRNATGTTFEGMGYAAYWWTRTENEYVGIAYDKRLHIAGTVAAGSALSVRCVRNDN